MTSVSLFSCGFEFDVDTDLASYTLQRLRAKTCKAADNPYKKNERGE